MHNYNSVSPTFRSPTCVEVGRRLQEDGRQGSAVGEMMMAVDGGTPGGRRDLFDLERMKMFNLSNKID